MAKKRNSEAKELLLEARRQKAPSRKNWFQKLASARQKAILDAYAELPESGASASALARAIVERYGVEVNESSIRYFFRSLERQ